jgi:hypothetical protein
MAFGVEPVAPVFDQRDRAVEIGDYNLWCFHFTHSILTTSPIPSARRKLFSSKTSPTPGTAIANIAFEKSNNKNEFS